jgi:hypothetical protein
VLLFAVLFGFALHTLGARGRLVFDFIDKLSHAFFGIVGIIMKVAPIGAFGAMAFTIGSYGVGALSRSPADGLLLRDVPDLHLRRAGLIARAARLRHLAVHQVHQGRAASSCSARRRRSRCCRG